ncbi:carbohydrate kinase family protein [Deinococcota bacterium DY0809b]
MRFFVIGDVSVDLMYFVDAMPGPGEETPAQRALIKPGGAAATVAANLASLGHKVALAARVGTGPFREAALVNLKRVGVDLGHLQEDEERPTSSILVFVIAGGERTMVSSASASRHLDAAAFKARALDQVDAVVVSAYALAGGPSREYTLKVLAAAAKRQLPVFADLGTGAIRAAGEHLLEDLRGVDYLLMNQHELAALTGEASISGGVQRLRVYGIERAVVKLGALGSMVVTPETEALVEPHVVDDVIDSTGAGDAYTAAFAATVMEGRDLLEAARRANVAGALVATHVGAQGYLVKPEDLELAASSK